MNKFRSMQTNSRDVDPIFDKMIYVSNHSQIVFSLSVMHKNSPRLIRGHRCVGEDDKSS